MPIYDVRWSLQIEADSKLEAAKIARDMQRESENLASTFDVSEEGKGDWEAVSAHPIYKKGHPIYQENTWFIMTAPGHDTDDEDNERVTPIGSLVLIDQTFEGEDNYSVYCPATGGCFFMDDEEIRTLTMPVPTVYDVLPSTAENGVMDRFTVFPAGEIETLKERYEYLGCSLGGRAASMWGEIKLTDIKGDFSGLGRRVPFHELDVDTQRHIFNRLKD